MNTILVDLKNLQEVDDLTRQSQRVLDEGAARLAGAGAGLKLCENRLISAKTGLETMRKRHRSLEAEVADLSVKKKNNENRQSSIKNANEYAALIKEAEFLANRIGELEDETLDLLDRMEKDEAEISDLETSVSEEAAIYAQSAAEIKKAQADSQSRLAELARRRACLIESLPADQFKRYEDIARVRAGRAVAAATKGLCQACQLGFPPQIFNDLQRNEKILICPNCNRIIYWQDHPDFKIDEASPPCSAFK